MKKKVINNMNRKKSKNKAELYSAIGHLVGLNIHFLLNMKIISLFAFCVLSFIPPITFTIAGYFNKDRAFMIGQIGWFLVALVGVFKNFNL